MNCNLFYLILRYESYGSKFLEYIDKMDNNISLHHVIELAKTQGETSKIEFKSAKGVFPGSLWESYSAFAITVVKEEMRPDYVVLTLPLKNTPQDIPQDINEVSDREQKITI